MHAIVPSFYRSRKVGALAGGGGFFSGGGARQNVAKARRLVRTGRRRRMERMALSRTAFAGTDWREITVRRVERGDSRRAGSAPAGILRARVWLASPLLSQMAAARLGFPKALHQVGKRYRGSHLPDASRRPGDRYVPALTRAFPLPTGLARNLLDSDNYRNRYTLK